jgi:hypothetical protein
MSVMTKGLPFITRQLSFTSNEGFIENIRAWMKATRRLTRDSGLTFLPKLQLKFPVPLNKVVEHLLQNPDDTTWHDSVKEIWQNQSNWIRVYAAPEED